MKRRIRILGRLGLIVVALVVLVAAVVVLGRRGSPGEPAATPTGSLYGVDVSSHNEQIQWGEAAASGLSFAFARATEGNTRVDAAYAAVRLAAQASGLAFTAYHYARPGPTTKDARKEAAHFLHFAGLEAGDLAPVLDLEESAGLEVDVLQSWVWAWLGAVEASLGVKPVIYTSPNFWQFRMGDTTAFADAGYKLAIASWGGTPTPVVPAQDWGGLGWTFWQTSTCGHVTGVPGCVDSEVFNGADLQPLRIP
jgi:GH25 family lysozyme M1 (1,4-beta-N-acetylmuramidase)